MSVPELTQRMRRMARGLLLGRWTRSNCTASILLASRSGRNRLVPRVRVSLPLEKLARTEGFTCRPQTAVACVHSPPGRILCCVSARHGETPGWADRPGCTLSSTDHLVPLSSRSSKHTQQIPAPAHPLALRKSPESDSAQCQGGN